MPFNAGNQILLGFVGIVRGLPVSGTFPAGDIDEGERGISRSQIFVQVRFDKTSVRRAAEKL